MLAISSHKNKLDKPLVNPWGSDLSWDREEEAVGDGLRCAPKGSLILIEIDPFVGLHLA